MTANHQIAFHNLRRESAVAEARHRVGVDTHNATMRQQHLVTRARDFADRAAAPLPVLMEAAQ
ncbi:MULTISPECIES: hypothetical protein [Streptomyces]|uniref:hypothetical protein n=1 Tax=Streptomyces TaxID=1883 RepID=UPI0034278D40